MTDSLLTEMEDPDEEAYDWESIGQLIGSTINQESQGMIRQRLQFVPGVAGWRLLSKGYLKSASSLMTFFIEQDPEEWNISDHSAFSISLNPIPGINRLVIGDFRIRTVGNYLHDQTAGRLSVRPGSLFQHMTPGLRSHYSSREYAFFRGVASQWERSGINLVTFISSRKMLGRHRDGIFVEDISGLHIAGNTLSSQRRTEAGIAAFYTKDAMGVALATQVGNGSISEFGLQWRSITQRLQLIGISGPGYIRGSLAWSKRLPQLWISSQYRVFLGAAAGRSPPTRMLRGAEQALSFRAQLRPHSKLQIFWTLDGAKPLRSDRMEGQKQFYRYQYILSWTGTEKELMLKASKQVSDNLFPSNIWAQPTFNEEIWKGALAFKQDLAKGLSLRLNGKVSNMKSLQSFLIQQRLTWKPSESFVLHLGYVRYLVPHYRLSLSIYEAGLLESYSFFTAHGDGQRWYTYFRYKPSDRSTVEVSVASEVSFKDVESQGKLNLGFQLSIVL